MTDHQYQEILEGLHLIVNNQKTIINKLNTIHNDLLDNAGTINGNVRGMWKEVDDTNSAILNSIKKLNK